MDETGWWLEIRVSGETSTGVRRPAREQAAAIAEHLSDALGDDFWVESNPPTLNIGTTTPELVELAQRELDIALKARGAEAVVRVRWRLHNEHESAITQAGYRAPRTGRPPGRRRSGHRRRTGSWSVAVVLAALAGGTWYGLSPGVASYQAGFVLMLPLMVVVLVWLHRRLPRPLQWSIAVALAVTGPAGYVIVGGSQWWAWGQAAIVPLVLLVSTRNLVGSTHTTQPWYGGHVDGPWGPP